MIKTTWPYVVSFLCGGAAGWVVAMMFKGGLCSDRLLGIAMELRGYANIAAASQRKSCLMSEQALLDFADAIEDECRPDPPQVQ